MGFKRPRTLSATFVWSISRPGRYGDGRGGFGLSLLVKPMANGRVSKTWSQRVRINGKPSNIGLGGYPLVTLAEARAAALENARIVRAGKDPRRGGGVPTFAQAAEKVIDIYGVNWRDRGKSEKQWRASLETYVFPVMGRKLISEITTVDVMAVLTPIWNTKRETAKRVRQRIGAIYKWAVAQGHRLDNPAGSVITAALPKDAGRRKNHVALPYPEVADAIAVIRGSNALKATERFRASEGSGEAGAWRTRSGSLGRASRPMRRWRRWPGGTGFRATGCHRGGVCFAGASWWRRPRRRRDRLGFLPPLRWKNALRW